LLGFENIYVVLGSMLEPYAQPRNFARADRLILPGVEPIDWAMAKVGSSPG